MVGSAGSVTPEEASPLVEPQPAAVNTTSANAVTSRTRSGDRIRTTLLTGKARRYGKATEPALGQHGVDSRRDVEGETVVAPRRDDLHADG